MSKRINKRMVKAAICRVLADAIAEERDYCLNDGIATLSGEVDDDGHSDLLD